MTSLIKAPPLPAEASAPTQSAEELRQRLEASACMVIRVVNEATLSNAVKTATAIRRFLKDIENERKEVKSPYLTVCTAIDDIARNLTAKLTAEVKRIDALAVQYAQKLRDAEEAKRRAEEEAAQAARAKAEQEAAAIRTKAEQQAGKMADPVAAQQVIDMADAKGKSVVASAGLVPRSKETGAAVGRPSGLKVQSRWTYRVTDVWALAKASPALVRIEPVASAINQRIRDGMRECPGLEIYEEVTGSTSGR